MSTPEILRLTPNRVWRSYLGGRTLDELEGRPDPRDSHYAEDWIASTTPARSPGSGRAEREGHSRVELGGEVRYLEHLLLERPDEMLGRAHFERYGPKIQFLMKLLDSAVRLHVQAHPTATFALKHLASSSGKAEGYVILGTRQEVPDPFIYLGFQHPPTRARLRRAVLEQDTRSILECFKKIPVREGDVFYVPGGLPHAIGAGIFMIEVMEPSDLVVRLEFESGGYVLPEQARFMGRDVDLALDMIDFTALSVSEVLDRYFCRARSSSRGEGFQEEVLIGPEQTSCFSVHRLKVAGQVLRESASFHVGIVTRGQGWVDSGTRSSELRRGDRFFVPYAVRELRYEGELEIVLAYPPEP